MNAHVSNGSSTSTLHTSTISHWLAKLTSTRADIAPAIVMVKGAGAWSVDGRLRAALG